MSPPALKIIRKTGEENYAKIQETIYSDHDMFCFESFPFLRGAQNNFHCTPLQCLTLLFGKKLPTAT